MNNLIYKFNAKCDTCQKVFKMVAVSENGNLCVDCLGREFEKKYKINPKDLKLDKKSEEAMNKEVDKIVKVIKKENE